MDEPREAPHVSLAPNRLNGVPMVPQPQPYTPSAPATSHMRTYVDGVEQPFIVRGAEEDEEEPAPQTAEALGLAQKQNDEDAYRRLQDRSASRSRADYAGQQEDRKLNEDMLRIRRLRNATGRDLLHPWELKQGPAPRLAVPPAMDRRADRQG